MIAVMEAVDGHNPIRPGELIEVCGGKYKGRRGKVLKFTPKMVVVRLTAPVEEVRICRDHIRRTIVGEDGSRLADRETSTRLMVDAVRNELRMMNRRVAELTKLLEELGIEKE
jgi:ribosomal protein L24